MGTATQARRSRLHAIDRFNDGVVDRTKRSGVFIAALAQLLGCMIAMLVVIGAAFKSGMVIVALATVIPAIAGWFGFKKLIRALAGEKQILADNTHGVARLATAKEMKRAGMLRRH